MIKRFLEWIKIKEFLHNKKQPPGFNEGEIWWANIGENIGHEENGKDVRFVRPFVIIKKFNKDLLFGVPCSSVNKENKYYYKISMETLFRMIDKIGSGSFRELKTALNKAIFE